MSNFICMTKTGNPDRPQTNFENMLVVSLTGDLSTGKLPYSVQKFPKLQPAFTIPIKKWNILKFLTCNPFCMQNGEKGLFGE